MLEPKVGKIYKSTINTMVVQIVRLSDKSLDMVLLEKHSKRDWPVGTIFLNANLADWKYAWLDSDRSIVLNSHHNASVVCEDCHTFCKQLCQLNRK